MGKTLVMPIFESRRTYLYKEGNECIDITGGWGLASGSSSSLIKHGTYIEVNRPSATTQPLLNTINSIQFLNYDFVKADVAYTNRITFYKSTSRTSGYVAAAEYISATEKREVVVIPTSELINGFLTLSPTFYTGDLANIKMYSLWLE